MTLIFGPSGAIALWTQEHLLQIIVNAAEAIQKCWLELYHA